MWSSINCIHVTSGVVPAAGTVHNSEIIVVIVYMCVHLSSFAVCYVTKSDCMLSLLVEAYGSPKFPNCTKAVVTAVAEVYMYTYSSGSHSKRGLS